MHYKWQALALLWVAFFLQQGMRQIFGATLTSIQGSLGVNAAEIGAAATAVARKSFYGKPTTKQSANNR